MRAGVTLVDPRSAHDRRGRGDRRRHGDRADCVLRGATTIGDGVTIGAFTTLIDSEIGDGATVLRSHLAGRTRGRQATVGPFAYLRPGAVLREGAKAGTFVEIKNSDDRRRHARCRTCPTSATRTSARAPTSAPATITANYDGRRQAPHHDRRPRAHQRGHHASSRR